MYGVSAPSFTQTNYWVAEFKHGRVTSEHELRQSRSVVLTIQLLYAASYTTSELLIDCQNRAKNNCCRVQLPCLGPFTGCCACKMVRAEDVLLEYDNTRVHTCTCRFVLDVLTRPGWLSAISVFSPNLKIEKRERHFRS